jgi:hypothetical protein
MTQRGIPPRIINWLFEYGAVEHQTGSVVHYFDKTAIRRISSQEGAQIVALLRKYFSVYIVVSDVGTIITVGWLNRHLRRDRKIRNRRFSKRVVGLSDVHHAPPNPELGLAAQPAA